MAMAVSSSEGKSYSEINMTPLIDVMLVLLIIFIITLPSQTHAIKIDNPCTPAAEPPTTPPEVIDLRSTSMARCCGTRQRSIAPRCRATSVRRPSRIPQPEVHIAVDKFSNYEIVAQTLADLQRRGLKKIGFVNNDFY